MMVGGFRLGSRHSSGPFEGVGPVMSAFLHAFELAHYGHALQDRAAIIETGSGLILAVADGAGGTSHGGRAADLVLRCLNALIERGEPLDDEETWLDFLAETDRTIAGDPEPGETTAVVLAATPGLICGASVGDSEAWLLNSGGWLDLTVRQRRKPLLGSGVASPVSFRQDHPGGVLVVGSDGLFKYAPSAAIRDLARRGTPGEACLSLIDRVRLPNGKLQDDVAVVICHLPGPS